jgi:hypothetical protein
LVLHILQKRSARCGLTDQGSAAYSSFTAISSHKEFIMSSTRYPSNLAHLPAAAKALPVVIDYEAFRRDVSRAREAAVNEAALAVASAVLRSAARFGAWLNRRAERDLRALRPNEHCYAK